MFKIGPIALTTALTLLTGIACASDKIVLTCSGEWLHIIHEGQEPSQYGGKVNNEHVIIDLDKKTVSAWWELNGPDAPLAITQLSEDSISFKGTQPSYNVSGTINRLTGDAMMYAPDQTNPDGFTYSMRSYVVTCKPVKPLF